MEEIKVEQGLGAEDKEDTFEETMRYEN